MKKTKISLLTFLALSLNISANEGLDDLSSILDEASTIATQKSINVDYIPSVVTVIDAQTYLDAGIQNVSEALGMLPGIQMQIGHLGQPITTIRGFKNPNALISDKVKILIDGVAINNEAAGTSGFFLDFPLDLVDRIEILRGPGSTVYGAGAIYGSVNIITKTGSKDKSKGFYVGFGSYSSLTSGGNFNTSTGDYEIYTDAYYSTNKKSLEDDDGEVTDEAKKDLSIGLKVINGGFEFLSRYKSSHYGNFYFREGDVSPSNDRGQEYDYFLSQLSYKMDINGYDLETKLKYSYRESDITAYASNSVALFENLFNAFGIPGMQDAFYIRDHQEEQNFEAEAILSLPAMYSNNLTIGTGIRRALITTNDFYSSLENAIDANQTLQSNPAFPFREEIEPAYWADPTSTALFSKTSRTISYLNIQDLITLNQQVDITLGARVDYYSDIGTHLSSRAGLVYRADDALIFKLLYGNAFRAPTFTERYSKGHIYYRAGDENLKEETVSTYEAVLIYKPNFYNRFSLNVFYSTLYDVIDLEEFTATYTGYQNMKERSSKGLEFEYFLNTKEKHDFYLNATYVDAQYTVPADEESPLEIDQSMPDISKYMFKAMYVYNPLDSLSLGTTWQYYAETTKTKLLWVVESDRATPVEAQSIFDETITYHFSGNAKLRFTIKNLFNEAIKLPSYYYSKDGGVLREGRNYYLTYKYTF